MKRQLSLSIRMLTAASTLAFASQALAAVAVTAKTNTPKAGNPALNTVNATSATNPASATNLANQPLGGTGGSGGPVKTVSPSGQLGNAAQVVDTYLPPGAEPAADEICACTATYSDGTEELVDECTRTECPDLETYNACRDVQSTGVMPIGGCRLLETCVCDCWTAEPQIGHRYGDDVFLSGVPNLWQFDYGCGLLGRNAVGCGPVAAAMVAYYWAEQGYDGLVDGFFSNGSTPGTGTHDWQELVKTFRDDYLDGGICLGPSGMYATLQTTMRNGIEAFFEDAGYTTDVDHKKVCNGCNLNEPEELAGYEGIALIRDELESGRPVIIGFNAGRATERTSTLDDDGVDFAVFSGDLSNGGDGWIDHYAVVTGYRNIDGEDVIFLNTGWDHDDDGNPMVDTPFLWEPGGKWLHLYTVEVSSNPDGDDWCIIDNGVDVSFFDSAEVDASFEFVDLDGDDVADLPNHPDAGASCGLVRMVTEYEYTPRWTSVDFECDPWAPYEELLEASIDDVFDSGSDSGGRDEFGGGNNAPMPEWIPPP